MTYSTLYTNKKIIKILGKKQTQWGDLLQVKYQCGRIGNEYAADVVNKNGNPIEDHFYQTLPAYPTTNQKC